MSSNFSADQSAQGVYDVAVEVVPHQDIVPLNSEGRPVPLRPRQSMDDPAALIEGRQENEVNTASTDLTAVQLDAPNQPGLVPEVNRRLAPEHAPVLRQVYFSAKDIQQITVYIVDRGREVGLSPGEIEETTQEIVTRAVQERWGANMARIFAKERVHNLSLLKRLLNEAYDEDRAALERVGELPDHRNGFNRQDAPVHNGVEDPQNDPPAPYVRERAPFDMIELPHQFLRVPLCCSLHGSAVGVTLALAIGGLVRAALFASTHKGWIGSMIYSFLFGLPGQAVTAWRSFSAEFYTVATTPVFISAVGIVNAFLLVSFIYVIVEEGRRTRYIPRG